MKNRLTQLLLNLPTNKMYVDGICVGKQLHTAESIADYLLSEGVVVPPMKVGQTVYCIRYDKARKPFVKPLGVLSVTICANGGFRVFTTKEDTCGKTVFLTREEAEQALREADTE